MLNNTYNLLHYILDLIIAMAMFKLITPFSCLLSGPSGAGKSSLLVEMVKKHDEVFDIKPTAITICFAHMQPAYEEIRQAIDVPVNLVEGLPSDLITPVNSVLIVDDLQSMATKEVAFWFIRKSHHLRTSIFYLVQNLFEKDPAHRTISINANYISKYKPVIFCCILLSIFSKVMFKSPRDSSAIVSLAKQIYPGHNKFLVDAYREATKEPFSHLLIDLKQATPDIYRLRSSVLPSKADVFVNAADYKPIELFKGSNSNG